MDKKIEIFEELLKQEDTQSLVSLRNKILKDNPSLIDKNISFGLNEFLEVFFNKRFNRGNKKINFDKINFKYSNFFLDIFSSIANESKEIDAIELYTLQQNENYSLVEYEWKDAWDNVYSNDYKSVLKAVKTKPNYSYHIVPQHLSKLNIFRFGNFIINDISTDYFNLPFMVGVHWFANDLRDYNLKLSNSKEYTIDHTKLIRLNDIFLILSDVPDEISNIDFIINKDGSIKIVFSNEHYVDYVISTKNIDELYLILKGTEQKQFFSFILKNKLNFSFEFNELYCSKIGDNSFFGTNRLHINFLSTSSMNYIMTNIDEKLNIFDILYYNVYTYFTFEDKIEERFNNFSNKKQLKLFKYIFAADRLS